MFNHLNLPSIYILLDNPVKPAFWKRSIKKQLGVRAYLKFLENCQECFLSEHDAKIGWPLPHWTVTIGDVQRTCATNFRIHLLVRCDGLEKDVARFQSRSNGTSPADLSCKLCGDLTEDASHFISCCPALEKESASTAPPQPLLKRYCQIMWWIARSLLTSSWVLTGYQIAELSYFCIEFLSSWKSYRISKLLVAVRQLSCKWRKARSQQKFLHPKPVQAPVTTIMMIKIIVYSLIQNKPGQITICQAVNAPPLAEAQNRITLYVLFSCSLSRHTQICVSCLW